MDKPKKVKPYTDRTRAILRTRSLRRFAGSKNLKPKYSAPKRNRKAAGFAMLSGPGGQRSHPMNLYAGSTFNDIEQCFHSSAILRTANGRPPLAEFYK